MTGLGTVLIVDDSETIRRLVRGHLEVKGYDVIEAEDGQEGIATCLAELPDVVMLDVEMPGLSGHEVLALLKDEPTVKNTPVVFLTSQGSIEKVLAALDGGAHDYLTKTPETLQSPELTARVGSAMRVKKLQDELHLRNEELDRSSRTDVLTGLFNRRHLQDQLRSQLTTARRHGQELGVVLLDIDHFKHVNDTYGHLAGDEVLVEFASRIERQLRDGDIAGRWGGEEFLLLLPQTGLSGTFEVGERIRVAIASEPFIVADAVINLTVSGGSAVGPGASGDDLVHRADTGLYEAKDKGRNRIVPTMVTEPHNIAETLS
jgi:two-component system, cell cycle response regulator